MTQTDPHSPGIKRPSYPHQRMIKQNIVNIIKAHGDQTHSNAHTTYMSHGFFKNQGKQGHTNDNQDDFKQNGVSYSIP